MPENAFYMGHEHLFYSFVKEIKYFAVLKLITDDDVLHLKTELYQLLAMMEELSVTENSVKAEKFVFIFLIFILRLPIAI